jgi:hypothetical protein
MSKTQHAAPAGDTYPGSYSVDYAAAATGHLWGRA